MVVLPVDNSLLRTTMPKGIMRGNYDDVWGEKRSKACVIAHLRLPTVSQEGVHIVIDVEVTLS